MYLGFLSFWNVFVDDLVTNLQVGHTHESIDQRFSYTSRRLHVKNAKTVTKLHQQLREAYNGTDSITGKKRATYKSGVMSKVSCVSKTFQTFFRFCYFQLRKMKSGKSYFRANVWLDGEYYLTRTRNHALLLRASDLNQKNETFIRFPDGKINVIERMWSK